MSTTLKPNRRFTTTLSPENTYSGGGGAGDLFTSFNSALTAGLLNPTTSPPPPLPTRSSPTLFEMMASEPEPMVRPSNFVGNNGVGKVEKSEERSVRQQRLYEVLTCNSPGSGFNDVANGDVKLTLSSKDGLSLSISVHKQSIILETKVQNKKKKSTIKSTVERIGYKNPFNPVNLGSLVYLFNGVVNNGVGNKGVVKVEKSEERSVVQQRLYDVLTCNSPGSGFNDVATGDVKLTLSSNDGLGVSMSVHKQVLVSNSRFFATKLLDRFSGPGPCVVEIADCDDIEVYIEALRLMYCKDLRRRLMKEDVCKVLGILKVSSAIGFNAGVLSCMEYLEAAPWAEDEEEKVASLLSELRLEGVATNEVLKRVSNDNNVTNEDKNDNEEVLLKLLHVVLEGKDEKARREMKGLVSKMLRENASQNDLKKESIYSACDGCLKSLKIHFLSAADGDLKEATQISRQADNLHWILDILIDRQMGEGFLKTWASQTELSDSHSSVPAIHRYAISRVTARLFVGVGRGQLLASKEARCLLLQTWLVPFYEDFGWMRRATKGLDRHLIEEGLSNTILTLPLSWQQEVFMSWFDRFLNGGDDCPNMQRGFEVWWRRAFWKRNGGQPERPRQMRISNDGS